MNLKAVSKLTELRNKAGLTQAQLAVLVGVTTNTIQNWEKEDGLSQLEKYLKLAEIFGLRNLKDLFGYKKSTEEKSSKQKGFSIEELRRLRENWGTSVTAQTDPNKFLVLQDHLKELRLDDESFNININS